MNAQDIRNLQEAYMNVYEQVVPDPTNSRSIGTPRVNPDSMKQYGEFKNLPAWRMKNLIKDINYGQQVKGPEKKITTQVAHLDLFDLIRGHLLDEGYAETPEAAEVIMANMSEEWMESIEEMYESTQFNDKNEKRDRQIDADVKAGKRVRPTEYNPLGDPRIANPNVPGREKALAHWTGKSSKVITQVRSSSPVKPQVRSSSQKPIASNSPPPPPPQIPPTSPEKPRISSQSIKDMIQASKERQQGKNTVSADIQKQRETSPPPPKSQ